MAFYTVWSISISIMPMLSELLKSYTIVLASQSPRRQQLLADMGIDFTLRKFEVDEDFSPDLKGAKVAEYLAGKKFRAAAPHLAEDELLITADTIVCIDDEILNKPADEREARQMLVRLSGKIHEVITGVCIGTRQKEHIFHDTTTVTFAPLSEEEINYYIRHFPPFDKAGGYGIQEWIGYVGIESINGSYFNVMGLPTRKLYAALKNFEGVK